MDGQARDAAAMPPPQLPPKSRNGRSHRSQVYSPHLNTPNVANQSPQSESIQTHIEEVEKISGSNIHTSEPEYTMINEEELATMAARSEEAMTEIQWMCEPFLDPVSNPQDPPRMELSTELIVDLGLGILFPSEAEQTMRGRGAEEVMPIPARTMQARSVAQPGTPLLSEKQRGKRKERDDGDESFEDVHVGAERQDSRPIKRVKSVHSSKSQHKSGKLSAKRIQQQPRLAPKLGGFQSGYRSGRKFDGPALQNSRLPRHAWVEEADPYAGGNAQSIEAPQIH